MSPDEILPIFFGTWAVLAIISFAILFLVNNAQLKRKLWSPLVMGAGLIFIAFTYAMGFDGPALYIMAPTVILITYLNLRSTKFCDSCGKTMINQNFWVKPEFCSKCGEKLQ